MPAISILVPVFQAEPFLRRCLDSLISQTHDDLEIILVDDGSSDGSETICDEYATKDARIQVIHQGNAGVSAARNVGLDAAKGEYILFVDSDDWIEQETCSSLLSTARRHLADIVCFGHVEERSFGETIIHKVESPGVISKDDFMRSLVWGDDVFQVMLWNKLFSRNLFDGLRFTEGRIHEDLEIMHKLVHRADLTYATNQVFYHYVRRDQGSITSNLLLPKSIKDRIYANKERLSFLYIYYPELIDKQLTMTLRLILIGLQVLKGEPDYPDFKKMCDEFIGQNRDKIKACTPYSRLIWLFYYCKPLASLYVHLLIQFSRK